MYASLSRSPPDVFLLRPPQRRHLPRQLALRPADLLEHRQLLLAHLVELLQNLHVHVAHPAVAARKFTDFERKL